MKQVLHRIFFLFLLLLTYSSPGVLSANVWVLIDTQTAVLKIMNDKKTLMQMDDISVGRAGVTDLHIKGDDKTPTGEFRIVRINNESRFRRFFEINYPTIKHAQKAMSSGVIDKDTYTKIKISQQANGHSPQNTKLGGHLGIHGLGGADPEVHQMFNWTNGCIALTNHQIDQLFRWISLGTRVVIE